MPSVAAAVAAVLVFAVWVGAVRVAVVSVVSRPTAPAFTSAPVAAEPAAAVLDVAVGGTVDILDTVALVRFGFKTREMELWSPLNAWNL